MAESRKSHEEMRQSLRACPPKFGIWRHYKGAYYRVTGAHIDEATGEPRVDYETEDGLPFSRPLSQWKEILALPDGKTALRYAPVFGPSHWGGVLTLWPSTTTRCVNSWRCAGA